jgi:hypothetical protein
MTMNEMLLVFLKIIVSLVDPRNVNANVELVGTKFCADDGFYEDHPTERSNNNAHQWYYYS